MEINFWQNARGDKIVIDAIEELRDEKLKKKIYYNLRYLNSKNNIIACLQAKFIYSIKGSNPQIYEIITKGTRILFCIKEGTCWLLTFFWKDSNKTRLPEIRKAEQRAKEILTNN